MILMVFQNIYHLHFIPYLDVSYKIVCHPETPEIVKVNMIIKSAADLKR